jgi:hypothetical protein
MKEVDGMVAVSPGYIRTLEDRYPRLSNKPSKVLPFGAAERDIEIARERPQRNRYFNSRDGMVHGVYVGRGGADMALALRIIFQALKLGIEKMPERFSNVRLHFVGTDYACGEHAKKTIEPVAGECGVGACVDEHPLRVPYFDGLQLLLDADFLIVPGSDDPQYTASKVYPYILAGKPTLAVFHEESSVCGVMRDTRAGELVRFKTGEPPTTPADELLKLWSGLLARLPFTPATNWAAFEPFRARRRMAQSQCELFDEVICCRQ